MEPWDQQDGEPIAAYKRFLLYLYLGRSRTLLDAYRLYVEEATEGFERHPKDREPRHVSGSWAKEAREWRWTERADRYDVYELHRMGRRVMQRLMDTLETHVDQLASAAGSIAPANYGDYLKGLDALAKHFPPELMQTLLESVLRPAEQSSAPPSAGPVQNLVPRDPSQFEEPKP